MNFNPLPFLKNMNITVPIQKGGRWYVWLNAVVKSFNNASITYFNDSVDNSILDSEGNTCDIIAIPIIERTFDNDYIHVLNDLSKRYIYLYLISKLISSEGNNPEHDITRHLFTPDLRGCKKSK